MSEIYELKIFRESEDRVELKEAKKKYPLEFWAFARTVR